MSNHDVVRLRLGIADGLVVLLVLLLNTAALAQTTIYVDAAAGGGGDGTSWATAYQHLQDALDDAAGQTPPVEVWVAAGAYRPDQGTLQTPGDETASFGLLSGVAIYGGFFGDEVALDDRDYGLNATILTGDLVFDNSYHVIQSVGVDVTAILDGVIITAGDNTLDTGGFPNRSGAGLLVDGGAPGIANCIFTGNIANSWGGAVSITGAADPEFINCAFVGNCAGEGGAIYVFTGSVNAVNCTMTANDAISGGAVYANNGTSPTIVNSIVWGNTASDSMQLSGGGTYAVSHCDVQGGFAGIGNIDADPLFKDVDGDDDALGTEDDNVRLLVDSPCSDAGDNAEVPIGVDFDLDQNARFLEGHLAIDTGTGTPPLVDMGAYEFDDYLLGENVFVGLGDGTSWFDPANWSQGFVPLPGTAVFIGLEVVIDGGMSADASAVEVFGGGNLVIEAGATLNAVTFTMQADATLTIEIGGDPASGSFGQVDITNTASLDGMLSVDLVNGYVPAVGEVFDLLLAGNVIGIFSGTAFPTVPGQNEPAAFYAVDGVQVVFGRTVIFVDKNAIGADDGTSWTDAFASLQDALVAAALPDPPVQIWMAGGTYRPIDGIDPGPEPELLSFGVPGGVSIYGHFAGDETSVSGRDLGDASSRTVLSGDLLGNDLSGFMNRGDNSKLVVVVADVGDGVVIDGVEIRGGNSPTTAGGMWIQTGTIPARLSNCRFLDNDAASGGGGLRVGTNSVDAVVEVINCEFIGNRGLGSQGGAMILYSPTTVVNCTFTGNTSNSGNHVIRVSGGGPVAVVNCVMWDNGPDGETQMSAIITASYSVVEGGFAGTGNIDADPLFMDPLGPDGIAATGDENLRLSPTSPAVDSGDNTAVLADTEDLDGDLDTSEPVPFDIVGLPRRVEDPLTIDAGNGSAPFVDMGAYELDVAVDLPQTVYTGLPGGTWFDDQNWSTGSTPGVGTDVLMGQDVLIDQAGIAATLGLVDGAVLIFEIGGTPASGQFGSLSLSGDLSLAAEFSMTLANGYEPAVGDTYQIMMAGSVTGQFESFVWPSLPAGVYGVLLYDEDGVRLSFNDGALRVRSTAGAGGDGASWGTAFASLAETLVNVVTMRTPQLVPEIWMAGGTYRPIDGIDPGPEPELLSFEVPAGVSIYGHFTGDETSVSGRDLGDASSRTVLSGDLLGDDQSGFMNRGDNSELVVRVADVGDGVVIDGVEIRGGNSPTTAGGMWIQMGAIPARLSNCRFLDNDAASGGGGLRVGTNSVDAVVEVINCEFIGNRGLGSQGGAMILYSPTTVVNCTFTGNTSIGVNHVIRVSGGGPVAVVNCVMWNNGPAGEAQVSATVTVDYSVMEGGYVGTNVVDADPLFMDPLGPDGIAATGDEDLRLSPTSPAVDSGDNTAVLADTEDLDGDLDTSEPVPLDVVGLPRRVEDPLTIDAGNGTAPFVDMGAYEFNVVIDLTQTVYTGTPGGTWFDDQSWSTGSTPDSGADVLIGQDVLIDQAGVAATLGLVDGAVLTFEIGGTPASGQFGSLSLSGDLSLAAEFSMTLANGYEPAVGDTYQIMTAGSVTGRFESFSWPTLPAGVYGTLIYDEDGVRLSFNDGALRVRSTAAAGGDGASWDTAFTSLADTLVNVVTMRTPQLVPEVWMAGGTYRPTDGIDPGLEPELLSFEIPDGVSIYGHFAGDETALQDRDLGDVSSRTVLSGDLMGNDLPGFLNRGDNSELVVRVADVGDGVVIDGVEIRGGNSPTTAGGMWIQTGTIPARLSNCCFLDNDAASGGGGLRVGTSSVVAEAEIINCEFIGNRGLGSQGGAMILYGPATVVNCTFTGNTSISGNHAIRDVSGATIVANSVIWDNGPGGETQMSVFITASYSVVEGGFTGTGNIDADPLFMDPLGPDGIAGTGDEDLRLDLGSPCIDAGDSAAVSMDSSDLDGDGDTAEVIPFDQLGSPRFVDAPAAPDTGVPDAMGRIVDMGAHELQPFEFSGSGSWFDPGLWTFGVPGDGDIVFVSGSVLVDGPGAEAGSLTITAGGILTLSTIGELTLAGLEIDPAATLAFELDSAGPATMSGQVIVTGTACLDGTLELILAPAYTPVAGQLFHLVDGANVQGQFASVSVPPLPAGLRADVFVRPDGLWVAIRSATLFVDADRPVGGFGSSWSDAYSTLHEALNDAQAVAGTSEVWVAEGIYRANGSNDTFTLVNERALYGGFVGLEVSSDERDIASHPTVLSGDVLDDDGADFANYSDNALHVLTAIGVDRTAVLDGFVITAGHAAGPLSPDDGGGGVLIENGSPLIRNCRFVANLASESGGAVLASGLAVPGPALVQCAFVGNRADGPGGGGLAVNSMAVIDVVNGVFIENQAFAGRGGAAEVAADSTLSMTNCLLNGNVASDRGGALSCRDNSLLTATNCTITSNISPLAAGVWADGATATLENCIFWFSGGEPVGGENTPSILATYCDFDVPGSISGLANFSADPNFVDADGVDEISGNEDDDLSIADGSPCIDRGRNTDLPADAYDLDDDTNMGESIPVDLVGNLRRFDDPSVPDDDGLGTPPIVDVGAYESVSEAGTILWASGVDGAFGNPSNWSPDQVPGPLNTAQFGLSQSYTVSLAASRMIDRLIVVDGSPQIDLGGNDLTLLSQADSAIVVGDDAGDDASLRLIGGMTSTSAGVDIGRDAGAVGTLILSDPGTDLDVPNNLNIGLAGQGVFVIENGAMATTNQVFMGTQQGSFGTVLVSGAGTQWTVPFVVFITNGLLSVEVPALVVAGSPEFGGVFLLGNGELAGDGTVDGRVINFGAVKPGPSTGTLTVEGDYFQVGTVESGPASGSLTLEIGAEDHDVLNVTGTAELGGGLLVELIDGFEPDVGAVFEIIEAGTVTEQFDVAFTPGLPGGKFMRLLSGGEPAGPMGSVTVEVTTLGVLFGFDDPESFNVTGTPTGVAVDDLDGNTFVDLAIAVPNEVARSPGSVLVLLNNGNDGMGNWLGFSGAVQYGVGVDPSSIAAASLDGGTSVDLAVANAGDDTFTLLINDGGGVFSTPLPDVDTGTEPRAIVAGDFNEDGVPDLAVANTGADSITIFLNNGDATFPLMNPTYMAGVRPAALDPTDVDEDRCLDLVAVNEGSNTATVFINRILINGGVFDFDPPLDLDVGVHPVAVDGGDFDGDGDHDIVTINDDPIPGNPDTASVLLGNGDGTFAPAVNLPVGTDPSSLTVVDLEPDGDLDIAVVAENELATARVVQILRNDLNQGTQLIFADAEEFDVGANPILVTNGDLDNDTDNDLIAVNEALGGVAGAEAPAGPTTGTVEVKLNQFTDPAPACPADTDGDNVVNVTDLLAVILEWGCTDPPGPCAADTNADGTVDVQDLLNIILAWGACP